MTTVELIDAAEAARRRTELVARLPFSEEELRARARSYQLTTVELAILDEIDELDFLLGE